MTLFPQFSSSLALGPLIHIFDAMLVTFILAMHRNAKAYMPWPDKRAPCAMPMYNVRECAIRYCALCIWHCIEFRDEEPQCRFDAWSLHYTSKAFRLLTDVTTFESTDASLYRSLQRTKDTDASAQLATSLPSGFGL